MRSLGQPSLLGGRAAQPPTAYEHRDNSLSSEPTSSLTVAANSINISLSLLQLQQQPSQ